MRSTRLKGHGLRNEGRLYVNGQRVTGEGQARCECGATSESLKSDSARQRWHAAHKLDVSTR